MEEPPGSYGICPVCFWEDDQVQLRWPDWSGGANKPSLVDAQQAFSELGACEARVVPFVRVPPAQERREPDWRPADLDNDGFESAGVQEAPWPADMTTLYWWRPTFWRRTQPR